MYCCQNLHYAILNNHLECVKHYSSQEIIDEYCLTVASEHNKYEIIEYFLEKNCIYNDKFINFIKAYNIQDIQNFPLLKILFLSL